MTRAERIVIAAIIAIMLLLAAIAGGMDKADAAISGPVPFSPKAERFYEEALTYWNLPVPEACPTVTRELVPAGSLTPDLGFFEYEEGVYCRIQIDESVVRSCELRQLVFHETGHLVGLEHSTDPRSYMYPDTYQGAPATWQMCREEHPKLHHGATIHAGRAR
jgi:hypothetical protein